VRVEQPGVAVTTIDFYTHVTNPLAVAARLVAKAYAAHGSARVLTPDAATTDALDRMLWLTPPTGFLPHCRPDSPVAAETPVWIGHVLEHSGPAAVLVNLCPSPPPFFSRFERLAEIVGTDPEDAAAGRDRWRFYKERAYEMRAHNLAERGE
jgi:DNA polymerase-3 subunit chi